MNHLHSSASQNDFFKKIFHQSPNPMSVVRAEDGVYLEINEAFTKYYGQRRQHIIGKTAVDIRLIDPEERLNFLSAIQEKGYAENIPVKVLTGKNEVRYLLVNTRLIKIQNDTFHLTVGTDIPQFHINKKSLQSDILAKTFDAMEGTGVILLNGFETKKPSVLYVNRAAKICLETHPLHKILSELKKKESLLLKAPFQNYCVKIISIDKNSSLKIILMERLPQQLFFKEEIKKYKLTPRQKEITLLLSTGHSNRKIAEKLHISEYTVKDHLKDIFRVLGVHNRSELFPKLLNLR